MQSRLPGPPPWEEESIPAEARVGGGGVAHTHTLGRSSTAGSHLGPSEAGQLIGPSQRRRETHDLRKQSTPNPGSIFRGCPEIIQPVLIISSLWTRRAQILRPRTALLISLGVGRGWFPYYFWKKHIFSHYMKGIDLYVGRLLFVRFFSHPFGGRGPRGPPSPPHFDSTSNEHHSLQPAPPLEGISCGP